MRRLVRILSVLSFALLSGSLAAQPVPVTSQLETNRLKVGERTTLHVFAQVSPQHRPATLRIFSWNIDALLRGSAAARFDSPALLRPMSDNDPLTSSMGTLDALNLRSIRDSFLNHTNAGRDAPIELFSVPLLAVSTGRVSIAIQAGTLAEDPDFVVEPLGDGPTLTGGDYQNAEVQLDIYASLTNLVAAISHTPLPENRGRLVTVTFSAAPGYAYAVEYTTNLAAVPTWQSLPNPPHSDGTADDTNSPPQRFYRVRALPN